jgi:hypothetical protein
MSIEQSIAIPGPLKTLTGTDGKTYIIAPGVIVQARALTSGSEVTWQGTDKSIMRVAVTDAIATVVAGTDLFLVTLAENSKQVYISASRVSSLENSLIPGACRIKTLSDTSNVEGFGSIDVTQTVAQVKALILAAGTGGTGQQVATGSTAVVVSQSNVNIVTVTSPGQAIQLSDSFPETTIINSSADYFLVTPPTGSQIDTCSTNAGVRVLGFSVVKFIRLTATSWVMVVERQAVALYTSGSAAQAAASTGTRIVTAKTSLLTTSASTNNNFQLGNATTGERPDIVYATNTSAADIANMIFTAGFVDAAGVDVASPWPIAVSTTVKFSYMGPTVNRYLAIVVA